MSFYLFTFLPHCGAQLYTHTHDIDTKLLNMMVFWGLIIDFRDKHTRGGLSLRLPAGFCDCDGPCVKCVCNSGCVRPSYRWPPSRWENAGSLLVCVHMYQTQHVFPFQRRGILCVCACVCVYTADHTGRLTSRNPCSKNRHCVFPALAHHYHRTHTHTHTDHCPILFSLAGFLNAYPCASGCQDVSW